MIKIEATFIGKDSLGYKHGQPYKLQLGEDKSTVICREDGSGSCSYESLSSFMKNWNNISHLPDSLRDTITENKINEGKFIFKRKLFEKFPSGKYKFNTSKHPFWVYETEYKRFYESLKKIVDQKRMLILTEEDRAFNYSAPMLSSSMAIIKNVECNEEFMEITVQILDKLYSEKDLEQVAELMKTKDIYPRGSAFRVDNPTSEVNFVYPDLFENIEVTNLNVFAFDFL